MSIQESRRPRLVETFGRLATKHVERALGWTTLEKLHARARARGRHGAAYLGALLDELGVVVAAAPPGEVADRVPATGGLVVVANLPFGGIEALALLREVLAHRPDARVLADRGLQRVLHAGEFVLPPEAGLASVHDRSGLAPELAAARAWLEAGGTLVAFPGQGVGRQRTASGDPLGGSLDGPWSQDLGRLIELTGVPVLPVHVAGRPGGWSRVTGVVSARLREALLPRELLGSSGSVLGLRFGRRLGIETWGRYRGPENLMGYLRLATYTLASAVGAQSEASVRPVQPLAPPVDPIELSAEVAALPAERRLHGTGDLEVYLARAEEIPRLLDELGRLREQTFRAAGEGTGRPRDLDAHDQHYEHLFLWDAVEQRVVGAYRIGRTDRLLEAFGRKGLYTASLFQYRRRFLEQLGPALELGRAFVVPDYQRGHLPLLLLWQGIGRYLVANPRYVKLFGPVSISADYPSVTRYVMARRLLAASERRSPARGNFRPPRGGIAGVDLESLVDLSGSIEELGRLVADIDPAGRGIPVLLRQYLRLAGRVLAFNVDADFGGSLDALLVLDLRDSAPEVLRRYLGSEGLASFLAYQAATGDGSGDGDGLPAAG